MDLDAGERVFLRNSSFDSGLISLQEFAILTHEPVRPDARDRAWKSVVAEAMAESDPEKLQKKLGVAEAVIFERLQVLSAKSQPQSAEIRELREASDALLALKTAVLKFPHWRQQ